MLKPSDLLPRLQDELIDADVDDDVIFPFLFKDIDDDAGDEDGDRPILIKPTHLLMNDLRRCVYR